MLTGGLIKTGMVDLIGRRLYRIAGDNEFLLTALIMLAAADFSVGFEKYDDDRDVFAGRYRFGETRENSAVETC